MLENLRLRELIEIVKTNKAFYDEFVQYLVNHGYANIGMFVAEIDSERASNLILSYLQQPERAVLYDGVGRPYANARARWYFLAWLLRDAPVQRLEPLLANLPGATMDERRAYLLNEVRKFIKPLLPEAEHWTWPVISEVLLARLEGSRRALKGSSFENIVRQCLRELFDKHSIPLIVNPAGAKLGGETYDVVVIAKGSSTLAPDNSVLMPVKTRETMGGGHSLLFTRDIFKSVGVAKDLGYTCIPIIIAEAWSGDLDALKASAHIYIKANPNQVQRVVVELRAKLEALVDTFSNV